MLAEKETIFAPITPRGYGGVSIIRVSGSLVKNIVLKICGKSKQILNSPRTLIYTDLICSLDLQKEPEVIDTVLAVFFPAPHSFTGEDVLEINLHGSPFLVAKVLEILNQSGLRLARAGEFTERAFLNGKMDLSQAEAVADLIQAETEIQAKIAREQLSGKLSQAVSELGEPLRNLLAEIEAYIDFPEEDINPLTYDQWEKEVEKNKHIIETYLSTYRQGKICREGALVVLAGIPNAGKSSLLNKLLGEERAIVTDIAGTTRDSLEEIASIEGYCVRFCDTAGLADELDRSLDIVEKMGIERSWKKLEAAELVLYIFDNNIDFFKQERVFNKVKGINNNLLLVANKSDLSQKSDFPEDYPSVFISAKTGLGLGELKLKIIETIFKDGLNNASILISSQRHFEALSMANLALEQVLLGITSKVPSEFIAADIRQAINALNEIIGITPTEDILSRIFSKFCIGK